LDNTEAAYRKVLLVEVFVRANYVNRITLPTNDPSGFYATSSKLFSPANYLLVYAKDNTTHPLQMTFIPKSYDTAYSKVHHVPVPVRGHPKLHRARPEERLRAETGGSGGEARSVGYRAGPSRDTARHSRR